MSDRPPPPPPPDRPSPQQQNTDATPYRPLAPDLKKSIENSLKPVENKNDALARLDGAPLNPEKTAGRQVLNDLKSGLERGDPNAVAAAKALGEILYKKEHDHSPGAYYYSGDTAKLNDFRLAVNMVKADGDKLMDLVKPGPDRRYGMGEGGYTGTTGEIKATVQNEKVKTILEAKSVLGQAAAIIVTMRGGSLEQVRAARDTGTAVGDLAGAVAGVKGGRDQNEAVGRAAVQDQAVRKQDRAEVRPAGGQAADVKTAGVKAADKPAATTVPKTDALPASKSADATGAPPADKKTELTPDKSSVRESRNAELSAFGRELPAGKEDAGKGVHFDQFDQTWKFVTSSRQASRGANTADRASITEAQEYSKQLYVDGKVGLQRAGRVNEGGADFIVYNEKTNKIEVFDTKLRGPDGSFPTPKTTAEVLKKWGSEINRAVNGWTDANGKYVGGVDTGNPALDQAIRDAWKQGNVEARQINVRGPELPLHAPNKLGPL